MLDCIALADLLDHFIEIFLIIFHHGVIRAVIDNLGNLVGIGYGIMNHGIAGVAIIDLVKQRHESDQNQRGDQGNLGYQTEPLFHVIYPWKKLCIHNKA